MLNLPHSDTNTYTTYLRRLRDKAEVTFELRKGDSTSEDYFVAGTLCY